MISANIYERSVIRWRIFASISQSFGNGVPSQIKVDLNDAVMLSIQFNQSKRKSTFTAVLGYFNRFSEGLLLEGPENITPEFIII